jgi:hypothetical protein
VHSIKLVSVVFNIILIGQLPTLMVQQLLKAFTVTFLGYQHHRAQMLLFHLLTLHKLLKHSTLQLPNYVLKSVPLHDGSLSFTWGCDTIQSTQRPHLMFACFFCFSLLYLLLLTILACPMLPPPSDTCLKNSYHSFNFNLIVSASNVIMSLLNDMVSY